MALSPADYRPFLPRISRICEEFEVNFACLQVEKEIGQVWRQMGIMYGQLSNSISILEKVSTARHHAIYFSSSSSNSETSPAKSKIKKSSGDTRYSIKKTRSICEAYNRRDHQSEQSASKGTSTAPGTPTNYKGRSPKEG